MFQLFQGNAERYFVVVHRLRPPIKARYIRINPKSWYSYIAMRIELFGCRLGMLHFYFRNLEFFMPKMLLLLIAGDVIVLNVEKTYSFPFVVDVREKK